jgi:hypothetical protein
MLKFSSIHVRISTILPESKLAVTCNKNEQKRGVKNNAELWTELTKTTWKTFEEIIRRD